MQKWMEDRYNLDIDIIALPGWSDATSKISLLMGDETQRPDIIWWWNMEADYTKWVDAGLLVDVSPYMKKYTNMVAYYNSVDPGVMFYASGDNGITVSRATLQSRHVRLCGSGKTGWTT